MKEIREQLTFKKTTPGTVVYENRDNLAVRSLYIRNDCGSFPDLSAVPKTIEVTVTPVEDIKK